MQQGEVRLVAFFGLAVVLQGVLGSPQGPPNWQYTRVQPGEMCFAVDRSNDDIRREAVIKDVCEEQAGVSISVPKQKLKKKLSSTMGALFFFLWVGVTAGK